MKVNSYIKPANTFEIESIRNGYCDILLYENVLEIEKEDSVLYEYDMYRMKTPYREELYTIIKSDVSSWISRAKEIENDIMKNPFISDFERINIAYNKISNLTEKQDAQGVVIASVENGQAKQDTDIKDNMYACVELCDMILSLVEAQPLTMNLNTRAITSHMSKLYFKLLISGDITMEDIPERYKAEVEELKM